MTASSPRSIPLPRWLPEAPKGFQWVSMGRGIYSMRLGQVSLKVTAAGGCEASVTGGRSGYQHPRSRLDPIEASDLDALVAYVSEGAERWMR